MKNTKKYSDFTVLLPLSLLSDSGSLKDKTLKIGQIGRSLAIFCVNRVFVYDDEDPNVKNKEKEWKIISTLLEYMETPQYLRKDIFPYMDELKNAGLLPPLRTPHHPLQDERNEVGDFREGVVSQVKNEKSYVKMGLSEKGVVEGEVKEGERLTVQLGEKLSNGNRIVYPADREDVGDYWGYEVFKLDDLSQILSKESADYCVGTSRYGQNLYEVVDRIKTDSGNTVMVAFGGPYQGLFEICDRQGVNADNLFDVMVNTIPNQGTETVRAEEALIGTLAVLNILLRRK